MTVSGRPSRDKRKEKIRTIAVEVWHSAIHTVRRQADA